MSNNFRTQSTHRPPHLQKTTPPSKLETWTGGKRPELAVFYNVAYFRIAGMLSHYLNKTHEHDKDALELLFKKVVSGEDQLSDAVCSKLRDYLWKSYTTQQENSSGYALNQEDRDLVLLMLRKLQDVRNFQSHVWHDNRALVFPMELCAHIERMHEAAIMAQGIDMASAVVTYHDNYKVYDSKMRFNQGRKDLQAFFDRWDTDHYITQEGRIFFLSFFLTRSEMARLLQQSKGSKRNDKPEFKIKHAIYRYFTHRDAASRNHYGLHDNILSELPNEQRAQIMAARQVYKIINYLNDIPYRSHDPALFPLFLADGTEAIDEHGLLQWKQETDFLPEITAKARKVPALSETERFGVRGRKATKAIDDRTLEVERGFELQWVGNDRYNFTIPTRHFHRCALDAIRNGDKGATFADRLKVFIGDREHLLDRLHKEFTILPLRQADFTLEKELDEYYKFRLRGDGKLTKSLGQWLDAIDRQNVRKYPEALAKLKEQLRNSPIILTYHGLSFTNERKPRAADRFTEFAVKYLIDHRVVPDWLWGIEHFEPVTEEKLDRRSGATMKREVLKRKITYHDHVPEKDEKDIGILNPELSSEPRLAISDSHALVKHRQDDGILFRIGHRALKNILIAHQQGKPVRNLLPRLIEDLQLVNGARRNGTTLNLSTLKLFDKNSLAEATRNAIAPIAAESIQRTAALAKALHGNTDRMGQRTPGRIASLITELERFGVPDSEMPRMSRDSKNRQIMRCYKYFDWKYLNDAQYKFLRQHEYQNMSIYHYMLWDIRKDRGLAHGKYGDLLKGITPHMPPTVQQLLFKSRDLNDLLRNTATATIVLLNSWKEELLKPSIDDERLNAIMSRLGVPVSEANRVFNQHLPIAIHPMLPVRAYYSAQDISKLSLSRSIWKNKEERQPLVDEHYAYEDYLAQYAFVPERKPLRKRVIGQMNELITEDALLWKCAMTYLNNASVVVRDVIKQALVRGDQAMKVGSLFDATISIPLQPLEVKNQGLRKLLQEEFDSLKIAAIEVDLKFKQLDDYLFMESRPQLLKAACQVVRRFVASGKPDEVNVVEENGRKKYSMPYGVIYQEIQRIQNQAVSWAGTLLANEERVVRAMTTEERDSLGAGHVKDDSQFAYIGFADVCVKLGLSPSLTTMVRSIRNTTLHADLPMGWTYEEYEKDPVLFAVLGHVPKQPRAPKPSEVQAEEGK